MSIWRAPLLVLGVLLILLAAGAAALPWLVDFNRYKPQLQRWATQLVGREVRIGGDVRLALFPWPSARLREVAVAGVEGGRHAELLRVEEVRARLSLAALLGGRLEVEHITLLRPVLRLEHLGEGRGNWLLQPREGLHLPFSGERIRIDSVQVEGGQVWLADHRLRHELRIDDIDASLSAASLRGPWRLKGTWRVLERAWRMHAATGVAEAGKPLTLSLRMEPPREQGGHVLRFDGMLVAASNEGGRRLEGSVSLQPVLASGRGDPLDPARQVEVAGKLRVDRDTLELADVEITPRLGADSPFDMLRGNLRVALGEVLNAELVLRARRLELNRPLARLLGLNEAVRGGGGVMKADSPHGDGLSALRHHLRAVARRMGNLPPELLLELDLQADEMRVEGRVFRRVAMSAEVSPELLAVHHLRADAPGGASLSFKGNLLGGDLLQLTGELDARSDDARALLRSVAPRAAEVMALLWRGRGGRLRLLATLDLTDQALRLVSRRLALDDAFWQLDWRLHEPDDARGARRHALQLAAEQFDADRYLGLAGAGELARMLAQALRQAAAAGGAEVDMHLRAERLRLAGQRWQEVALALRRRDDDITLRELKVAQVAGLSVDGSGRFQRLAAGWRGEAKVRLRGEDGEVAQQLLRRVTEDKERISWLRQAGAVDVRAVLRTGFGADADAGAGGEAVGDRWLEASVDGQLGEARVAFSARGVLPREASSPATVSKAQAEGLADADWWQAQWNGQGELSNLSGKALLRLLGLRADLPAGAGTLKWKAQGVPVRRMQGTVEMSLPDTMFSAQGWAALPVAEEEGASAWPPVRGDVRLRLALEDAGVWARLADMALPAGVALHGSGRLAFSPGGWKLSKMVLRSGENRMAGALEMHWPEAGAVAGVERAAPLLRGDLVADVLDPALVARLLLGEVDAPLRWRRELAGGRLLDVVVRADRSVLPGWGVVLPAARLELKHGDPGGLHVVFRAGTAGQSLQVRGTLRREESGLLSEGELRAELPLEQVVRSADGAVRLAGQAEVALRARGRSATMRGWLAALRGEGALRVEKARLLGIAPRRLVEMVRGIDSPEKLARFDELARKALFGGAWALADAWQARLKLGDGVLEMEPVRQRQEGLEVAISGLMDIAARKLDVAWRFVPQGEHAPPPFEVVLAGVPGALALSADWALLRDWAQQQLLRRQEEELKRLEAERAAREALARRLEEEAARTAREQERQEELRLQAGRLHEQLQGVLSRAYRQMKEQATPDAKGVEGEAKAPSSATAATGESAGESDERKALDALIRQALEDEELDQAATALQAAPRMHQLPPEAQAQPQGVEVAPPLPRLRPRRPARRVVPARRKPVKGSARNSPARSGRAGNGRAREAARAARPATRAARPANAAKAPKAVARPVPGRSSAAKSAARSAARAERGGAARRRQQARQPRGDLAQPLTNWNRLAPASP